jgi:hypothetical protein
MKTFLLTILLLSVISLPSSAQENKNNIFGEWYSVEDESRIIIQELKSRNYNNYIIVSDDIYALSCLKLGGDKINFKSNQIELTKKMMCIPSILYRADFDVESEIGDVVELGYVSKVKNYFFNLDDKQLIIEKAPIDQCANKESPCEKTLWGKYQKK